MKILRVHKMFAAVGAGLLVTAAVGIVLLGGGSGVSFSSPSEFSAWAKMHGLAVMEPEGGEPYALMVNDGAGFEGSTFNAPRHGVVTVIRLHPSTTRPRHPYRVWGGVLAYGDESLLKKLEFLRRER